MVTSWHGDAFRITGSLWKESTLATVSKALIFSRWKKNCWTKSRIAGRLQRRNGHVTSSWWLNKHTVDRQYNPGNYRAIYGSDLCSGSMSTRQHARGITTKPSLRSLWKLSAYINMERLWNTQCIQRKFKWNYLFDIDNVLFLLPEPF